MTDLILRIVLSALLSALPPPAIAIKGVATWYDAPSSRDAAAGPLLRDALGPDWRGSWVEVCHGSRCVTVRLTDWCLCSKGRRLVDLDDRAFRELAPLSKGVVSVVVSTVDGRLPSTDTE